MALGEKEINSGTFGIISILEILFEPETFNYGWVAATLSKMLIAFHGILILEIVVVRIPVFNVRRG